MAFVVVTGLLLMFLFTVGWYMSNAMTGVLISNMMDELTSTTEGTQLTSLVLFLNAIWGPAMDIIVLVWMAASAQQRDVESEMYG